jgi:hypothetical protein
MFINYVDSKLKLNILIFSTNILPIYIFVCVMNIPNIKCGFTGSYQHLNITSYKPYEIFQSEFIFTK